MNIKSLIVSVGCAALLATPVIAGEMVGGKAPPPYVEPEITNLLDPIETTLSAGYDSSYMFRGFNLGQEAIQTGLNFSLPLAFPVGDYTLDFGAWYINPTQGIQNFPGPPFGPDAGRGNADDELDLYVSLGTTVGPFDVSVGYTHYFYPESVSPLLGLVGAAPDQNEFGLNLGTSLWMFDLGLGYYYNLDIGDVSHPTGLATSLLTGASPAGGPWRYGALDHYWEPSIGTGFDLTDRIGLYLSILAGWYSTDFSHMQYTASLPIQVAKNVVFEPYLSYMDDTSSGTLRTLRSSSWLTGIAPPGFAIPRTQDDFFAGAKLSISF